MNNYGYTVRYIKKGSKRRKVYLATNTYDSALWHVRRYERDPPKDRTTGLPIENAVWEICPIRSYLEYRVRFRGCPF